MEGLPKHVHVQKISGTTIYGDPVSMHIVWADRPYVACPNCGETILKTVPCPAVFNPATGEANGLSQDHGCGQWLTTRWIAVYNDSHIPVAADKLAAEHKNDVADARTEIVAQLTADLQAAMKRLGEPLERESGETYELRCVEITTGNDATPGVYQDSGLWVAWAYDPESDGETITIDIQDITGGY